MKKIILIFAFVCLSISLLGQTNQTVSGNLYVNKNAKIYEKLYLPNIDSNSTSYILNYNKSNGVITYSPYSDNGDIGGGNTQIWEHQVVIDDENDWIMPDTLTDNTLVFFNGHYISTDQWTYQGQDTLNFVFDVLEGDRIMVAFIGNETGSELYKEELTEDKTEFDVGFTISASTVISLNGSELRDSQWTGIGTEILELTFPADVGDYILVQK